MTKHSRADTQTKEYVGLVKSLKENFTTEKIALCLTEGMISGLGSLAFSALVEAISSNPLGLESLLEQTVQKFKNEMRILLDEHALRELLKKLKNDYEIASIFLNDYMTTGEYSVLDTAYQKVVEMYVTSKNMASDGLEIFMMTIGIMVSVYIEKSEFYPEFGTECSKYLHDASIHVENLLNAMLNKIPNRFGPVEKREEGHHEVVGMPDMPGDRMNKLNIWVVDRRYYRYSIDGHYVEFASEGDAKQSRENNIKEAHKAFNDKVASPAMKNIDAWRRLEKKLLHSMNVSDKEIEKLISFQPFESFANLLPTTQHPPQAELLEKFGAFPYSENASEKTRITPTEAAKTKSTPSLN